jgi:glutathionyl-hydroquinone reductase
MVNTTDTLTDLLSLLM